MDKIQKLLKRLSAKEYDAVFHALQMIQSGKVGTLDIKRLSGSKDIYRARVQNIRIFFSADTHGIEVLDISRRNEKTYKNF